MPESTVQPSRAAEMKRLAKEEFDQWANSYDHSLLHHFLFRPSYLVLMEEIAKWYAEHRRPFRVLDIGCGTGELACLIARAEDWPAEVVALDYSAAMCVQARTKAARSNHLHRTDFVTADSEFLPFADSSFDIVTCSNSFHHYPHQEKVVANVRRMLKTQGRFVLIDGFRDNIVGWVTFDIIITRVEGKVYHAPWPVIDGYFREAGFSGIRRRKFNFWMPLCATIGDAPA